MAVLPIWGAQIFLGSLVMRDYIFVPVAWTTAPVLPPFGLWQSRRGRYISSGGVVDMLSPAERKLLEKLAGAGKPTELGAEDLILGKILEDRGLLLVVRNSARAVITPQGRHALSGAPTLVPGKKPPLGFLG